MQSNDNLFSNLFQDTNITTTRLYDCAGDCLARLTQANTGTMPYTAFIDLLTPKIDAVGDELSDVDSSVNIRLGKTITVDQVIGGFKDTMSQKEGTIADLLGGRGTPAYKEFYPAGISEYWDGTKSLMPTLMNRVYNAADKNATALGTTLTTLLKSYKGDYATARGEQQQQKGAVSTNREERSTARIALELAFTSVVRQIGGMYPGDVLKCASFFSFNMLYPLTQHKHTVLEDVLAVGEIKELMNRTLTDNVKITLNNPDDNAAYIVWLAATATEAPDGNGIEVAPNGSIEVKPSELGSLQNTFLLVKNLSAVNEGAYKVEVVG